MPSGKRIDWSQYESILINHLPHMTIVDWCAKYAPHISPKAIGVKAAKLGVKPLKYKPTEEHKETISKKLGIVTEEIIEQVRALRDSHSKQEISEILNISKSTISRILSDHNITLSEDGIKRWYKNSREKQLNKEPWNKGRRLSIEHKTNMAIGRQRMSGRLSKLQLTFYNILDELNINYLKETDPKCRFGHWLFDCRINHGDNDILVEVQGDYIHSLPKNQSKDHAKATYMERYFPEIPIKYVWEHEFGAANKVKQKVLSWLGQNQIEQIDFNIRDVVVKEIEETIASEFLSTFHYIGKLSGRIKLGAFLNDKLIAVAIFSAPTRNETAIRLGCTNKTCLELRRFVIHDAYHKKNLGSYLLSKMEKLIPKTITTLVSFLDPSMGFDGTLYKASNWDYDGEAAESYYYVDDCGYVMLKKTLFNLANKMHMRESDYAETYNYSKVPTPRKQRFVRRLKK